jgi:hypothetical protein
MIPGEFKEFWERQEAQEVICISWRRTDEVNQKKNGEKGI